jgi:hypothetical protein
VRQAWHGEVWQGEAWRGRLGKAGLGAARRVWVWQGVAIFYFGGYMIYQWKVGANITADAEKVGKEVERIKGQKTPQAVVSYAESHPKSELYSCFEWDNDTAAEKYRLEQARHVMNCLVITKTEYDPQEKKEVKITAIRAYENVQTGEGRAYISTPIALETPEYRTQVFQRIKRGIDELERLGDTYSELLKSPKKFKEALQNVLEFV